MYKDILKKLDQANAKQDSLVDKLKDEQAVTVDKLRDFVAVDPLPEARILSLKAEIMEEIK